MLQPSRINVACQQDEKSTPTSISRKSVPKTPVSSQRSHTNQKPWLRSEFTIYGVVAKGDKETPENTHERKPPLTTHLRSQHENQKRLFQRNPSPSERRQAYEKLRQLQSLTRDTRKHESSYVYVDSHINISLRCPSVRPRSKSQN